MVYGYAIEPELVATWGSLDKYRYFYEKFGLGEPRLAIEYPDFKNWRRRVLKAASRYDGLELGRIIEMVGRLGEKMIRHNVGDYDGTVPWLENTEKIQEFDAILATANPREHAKVLTGALLGVKAFDLWNVKKETPVKRNPQDMSKAVATMLRNSSTAIFIDPYFRANESRWREPFKAFLSEFAFYKKDLSLLKAEVHVSADYDKIPKWVFFKQECEQKLRPCIPDGITVVFKRWAQKSGGEKLHNRYILTDIGGVRFQTGLDSGDEGETDDISLLSREIYDLRWQQYASEHTSFELAGEPFEISGTARR